MTRRRLPSRRKSWTQKARIGGVGIHLTMGEYPDGSLGEVFISVSRTGSAMRGTLDALAIVLSLALQHGTPVATITSALRGMDFQPQGPVEGVPGVTSARSVVDYLAALLETSYSPT